MELLIRAIASSSQRAEAYRPQGSWITEAEDWDFQITDQHLVIGISNLWRGYELRMSREEAERLIKKMKTAWEL